MASHFSCNHRVSLYFKVLEPAPGDLFRVVELRDFSAYLQSVHDGLPRHYVMDRDVVAAAGESQPASHFLLRPGSLKGPSRLAIHEQGTQVSVPRPQDVAVAVADSTAAVELIAGQFWRSPTLSQASVRTLGQLPSTGPAQPVRVCLLLIVAVITAS